MAEYLCPHCGNPIYDDEALLCHFCGKSLQRSGSGPISRMRSAGLKWVWITLVVLVLAAFALLFLH